MCHFDDDELLYVLLVSFVACSVNQLSPVSHSIWCSLFHFSGPSGSHT